MYGELGGYAAPLTGEVGRLARVEALVGLLDVLDAQAVHGHLCGQANEKKFEKCGFKCAPKLGQLTGSRKW